TGEDIFRDGGLPTLFTTPEQRETLNQISGMMSLLEGHGDVTMDRAGAGHVTNADVFAKTFRTKRNSAKGFTRIFQKIAGFEAKLNQYQAGENFIEEVEAAGGTELLDRAWEKPENLPNLDEIKSPEAWVNRINNQ
ncbi:MAG: zinc-dependent metalloprotease, partial [Actinomycetota bacterium]|nr:zinc-dependent metalloprotease [Actinomycetota bacterium]